MSPSNDKPAGWWEPVDVGPADAPLYRCRDGHLHGSATGAVVCTIEDDEHRDVGGEA